MNTPRATWPAPPSKVMKKAQLAQIEEISDPDDTDLGIEEGEIEAEQRPGMKGGNKSFHMKKKKMEQGEDSPDSESNSCDSKMPPIKQMKHKKISCHHEKMPERVILAHSYVPNQRYEKAFTPDEALRKGTLFPELWGVYPIPK